MTAVSRSHMELLPLALCSCPSRLLRYPQAPSACLLQSQCSSRGNTSCTRTPPTHLARGSLFANHFFLIALLTKIPRVGPGYALLYSECSGAANCPATRLTNSHHHRKARRWARGYHTASPPTTRLARRRDCLRCARSRPHGNDSSRLLRLTDETSLSIT